MAADFGNFGFLFITFYMACFPELESALRKYPGIKGDKGDRGQRVISENSPFFPFCIPEYQIRALSPEPDFSCPDLYRP